MRSGWRREARRVWGSGMTRVTLKEDDGRYSVVCEGHAVGSCEVCAAVSDRKSVV